MKVLLDYKSHHYFEEYKKDDALFCPNCGQKSVYVEQGPGDYYEGSNHLCVDCNFVFSLPSCYEANYTYKGVIEQIKLNKTFVPTNPRGN